MAINNVESVLNDPQYIKALETDLYEKDRRIEELEQAVDELRRVQ